MSRGLSSKIIVVLMVVVAVLLVGTGRPWLSAQDAFSSFSEALIAVHGTLLATAAIIFAVAFADVRFWPSLRYVAKATLLWHWVVLSACISGIQALSAVRNEEILSWLVPIGWTSVCLIGLVSCGKILHYSDSNHMNSELGKRLAEASAKDIDRFEKAALEAIAVSDEIRLRDLADQVKSARTSNEASPELTDALIKIHSKLIDKTLQEPSMCNSAVYLIKNTMYLRDSAKSDQSLDADSVYFTEATSRVLGRSFSRIVLALENDVIPAGVGQLVLETIDNQLWENRRWFDWLLEDTISLEDALGIWSALNQRMSSPGLHAIYTLYQRLIGTFYTGDYLKDDLFLADFYAKARSIEDTNMFGDDSARTLRGFIEMHLALMLGRCVYVQYPKENSVRRQTAYVERVNHTLNSFRGLVRSSKKSDTGQVTMDNALDDLAAIMELVAEETTENGVRRLSQIAFADKGPISDQELISSVVVGWLGIQLIRDSNFYEYLSAYEDTCDGLLGQALSLIEKSFPDVYQASKKGILWP